MFTRRPFAVVRFLACLAGCLQVFLPVAMPMAAAAPALAGHSYCSPSGGGPSPEALAALELFAELTGEDVPGDHGEGDHCPLCSLVSAAVLPNPSGLGQRNGLSGFTDFARLDPGFARYPQGPPLGSRAPPHHD